MGQTLWIVAGVIYLQQINSLLIDIILVTAGLTWLLIKPGRAPLILLSIYQLLALAVNIYEFVGMQLGDNLDKALVVHIAWRILALSYMIVAFLKLRKLHPNMVQAA